MTDQALTTTEPQRPRISATAMGMETTSRGSVPMPVTFGEVIALADVMSRSQHAIPAHLRDNPGACLAVTMQAMRWEMDPFAVASKTYNVKDLVAYEAQIIAAVVNTRSGLIRRPSIEYRGAGATRQCVVSGQFLDGANAEYVSPEIGNITTKNSPLWKSDPDQQLAYFSLRSFARRHCPEVILGVYDRDEIVDSPIEDVTPRNAGTGLLGRLQSTVDNAVVTEGFGIRDLNTEAGEAAAAPEPKKKTRKKAVDDALNKASEEIASEAADVMEAALAAHDAELAEAEATFDPVDPRDAEQAVDAPTEAVDAEVEETAADMTAEEKAALRDVLRDVLGEALEKVTGEPVTFVTVDKVEDGPAPTGVIYFLAGEDPYPSGRRAVWFNGNPNGSEDAGAGFPVYAEHPAEDAARPTDTASAPTAAPSTDTPDSATDASSPSPAGESGLQTSDLQPSVEPEGTRAATPLDHLGLELGGAESGGDVVQALRAYFGTEEGKAPDAKRNARLLAWGRVEGLNIEGAKIDPVTDPFLLACFIEASSDADVVEAQLPLAQDQEWFKAGGEAMQTGVARAVMDRAKAIRGA